MKKLFLLVLVFVIVGGLIPQTRSAEAAQPAAPTVAPTGGDADPARACTLTRTRTFRYGLAINGVLQVRHWQQIRWCYNRVRIQSWVLRYGYNDYSSSWYYYGYYTPIIKGTTAAKTFQTSLLFYGYINGYLYWWRSYIWQRITRAGGYQVDYWSSFWAD